MVRRSVGKKSVKNKRVQPRREVTLFNIGEELDDALMFDDGFIDDGFPDPARTTRDLTTVAVAIPIVSIIPPLISTL